MKPFKTIDEQIDILKSRGLLFENEEAAKKHILNYGYYEIVNAYKDFIVDDNDKFLEGEKFEHLFALFNLDKDLKNAVLYATLEVEMFFRTALAYHISNEFGHDEKNYLKRMNFKSGKKAKDKYGNEIIENGKPVFEVDYMLKKFNKILKDNIEPYKHYREIHGHIPVWILLKGASFGNLRMLFKLSRKSIKINVIKSVLGIPQLVNLDEDTKDLFTDLMLIVQKFRNRAAHSGRIFNYKVDYDYTHFNNYLSKSLKVNREEFNIGYGKNCFYSLFAYIKLLNDNSPFARLYVYSAHSINKYLKLYPDDKKYLFNQMGIPDSLCENEIDDILKTNN